MATKLYPLSRITRPDQRDPDPDDSVAAAQTGADTRAQGQAVLLQAAAAWAAMSRFRRERERNKRYAYGDQWGDLITTPDCQTITEEEYIRQQGSVPLKNNLIRRLVRSVLGVYRSQSKEPICTARDRDEQRLGETMSTILQCNMQLNRMTEVYARTMEEYLISGLAVHRKWYGWRRDKLDCWTDYVQPNNFFIDASMRDFRGWDVNLIGEIHDISYGTLISQFAHTPADAARLRDIYATAADPRRLDTAASRWFGYNKPGDYSFLLTTDPTRCRVIEVWRKETRPRYRCHDYNNGDIYKIETADYRQLVELPNRQRLQQAREVGMPESEVPLIKAEWFIDDYWYYYYLTPLGDILQQGETPYEHKSHPYVFKAYPFIDGEIHSFVADVIDQQRYTNRLITLYDWIMRASAKGVLLFPEECLPKGMSLDDIADEWSRFNGVIAIKTKAGAPLPQQVANNSTNIGISELLNLQLKFFEDISGVHGALQGRPGASSVSGTLYNQQAQNATMSLLDILDSFSQFVIDAAYKDVKNMQQYYDTPRVYNIAGRQGAAIEYDPKKIRDTEFDLSITESPTTPAYRQAANDLLMQIWQSGQINLQQLLETGDFPFADQLLQSIKSQQQQLQQGQQPQPLPQGLQQQAQATADPRAMQLASQFLQPQQ